MTATELYLSVFLFSSCAGKHLVLVTDVEKGEPEYAFDNPGFRGKRNSGV